MNRTTWLQDRRNAEFKPPFTARALEHVAFSDHLILGFLIAVGGEVGSTSYSMRRARLLLRSPICQAQLCAPLRLPLGGSHRLAADRRPSPSHQFHFCDPFCDMAGHRKHHRIASVNSPAKLEAALLGHIGSGPKQRIGGATRDGGLLSRGREPQGGLVVTYVDRIGGAARNNVTPSDQA
jgi:hypothetical protein